MGSSATCSPYSAKTSCEACYAKGCHFCEVGPEMSYWEVQGTGRQYDAPSEHDYSCIDLADPCEHLKHSRPNTHFTAPVLRETCASLNPTTTTAFLTDSKTAPASVTATNEEEGIFSGGPGEWKPVAWIIVASPVLLLLFIAVYICHWLRKRRARKLQRVYVAPAPDSKDGAVEWDFGNAGCLALQELQNLVLAISESEKSDGGKQPRPRHVIFTAANKLTAAHLTVLSSIMDRHSRVSIFLDADWLGADDASLIALTDLLKKRERVVFRAPELVEGYGGMIILRLPPRAKLDIVEGLVEAMTSSLHPEVDGISFFSSKQTVPGRMATVISFAPLRSASQEISIRRCVMASLGTTAVCAFVRPWSARLQLIRLEDCQVDDDGAVALARILSPALKTLILSGNAVGDRGVIEIAKVLHKCDSLERLLLDRNYIGDAGAKELGLQLPRSNVTELTLGATYGSRQNPIGEEGVEALAQALDDEMMRAAANRDTRLGALNLNGCVVGDRGAKALATLLPKSALMALSLSDGGIEDNGATNITKAVPKTLLSLDLSHNLLTDGSASIISDVFYRTPHMAMSLANNHLSAGLRTILHAEHGDRLRL